MSLSEMGEGRRAHKTYFGIPESTTLFGSIILNWIEVAEYMNL
jgi:hypothetical protein